jgi:hypothetical protein
VISTIAELCDRLAAAGAGSKMTRAAERRGARTPRRSAPEISAIAVRPHAPAQLPRADDRAGEAAGSDGAMVSTQVGMLECRDLAAAAKLPCITPRSPRPSARRASISSIGASSIRRRLSPPGARRGPRSGDRAPLEASVEGHRFIDKALISTSRSSRAVVPAMSAPYCWAGLCFAPLIAQSGSADDAYRHCDEACTEDLEH